jgi:hypothetical protein
MVPTIKIVVRIAWIDSCGMPSHIHLTGDGKKTLCDGEGESHAEYISGRTLAKTPNKRSGRSNYCRECFMKSGAKFSKSLPWDARCIETIWDGPGFPHAREKNFKQE